MALHPTGCAEITVCAVPKHAVALQWPSVAPLQGAHTALVLPAGEAVSFSIMAAWGARRVNIYTCNQLINADSYEHEDSIFQNNGHGKFCLYGSKSGS